MVKIVLTPDWFIGNDVLIEAFSLIVLALIAIIAIKNYKKNQSNRNLLYLSLGFTLLAIAQLASVLTKIVLYYDFGPSQAIGYAIVTSNLLSSVDIFYHTGFSLFKFLTLLGFYIIYRLPRDKKSVMDYVILFYFIMLSVIIEENFYFIFHITALMILIAIVEKYYLVYKKNGFINTKILIIAFSILAFSQLIFILSSLDVFFAAANIAELISYSILLGLGIRLMKNGEKKKPYGNYIRHAGNNPRKKRKH